MLLLMSVNVLLTVLRTVVAGCISRVLINGGPLQFAADSLQLVGVADCPSCRDRPCRNGGICQSAATKTGYECQCAEGYSGLNCELIGTSCLPGNGHFHCHIQEIHNAH